MAPLKRLFYTGKEKPGSQNVENGVQQKSVLALFLLNIYVNDLSATAARKFAHADDLALSKQLAAVRGTFTQNMATLCTKLQKWKLKPSGTKTMSAVFDFYKKKIQLELKIFVKGDTQSFCAEPTYRRIKRDRGLALVF